MPFIKNCNTYMVTTHDAMDIHETLPAANYIVKAHRGSFLIEHCNPFTLPKKIYGDTRAMTNRILTTFRDRPSATGVLFEGEKGSGKSLLAKDIASEAAARHGMPTLLINSPYHGEEFQTFIEQMPQPMILLFDEFEKVYPHEAQEHILTLLDGTATTKKLFIFTVNNKHSLSSFLHNRPGRIYYSKNFSGLSLDFVHEYVTDNLENQAHANSFEPIFNLFDKFNFDMLQALVEEMNRYNETTIDALKLLNIEPNAETSRYIVTRFIWKGFPVEDCLSYVYINPHSENFDNTFTIRANEPHYKTIKDAADSIECEEDDSFDLDAIFSPDEIVSIANGKIVYKNAEGSLVEIKLKRSQIFNTQKYLAAA